MNVMMHDALLISHECISQDIITRYSSIEPGARIPDQPFRVAGRIISKREASSKLIFYHIESGQHMIQVTTSHVCDDHAACYMK